MKNSFFENIEGIDKILQEGFSQGSMETLFILWANSEQLLEYFFNNAQDPEWIVPLSENGYFEGPVSDNGNAHMDWPQASYLRKMAQIRSPVVQSQVLEIMLNVGSNNNYRVHNDFALASLCFPTQLAKSWAEHETAWLRETIKTRGIVEEELAKLAVKLAEDGETDTAVQLMEEVLNVLPDPEAEAKRQEPETDDAFGLLNRIPEPQIRCESYHYKAILENQIPVLLNAVSMPTIEMLANLLLKIVFYSQRDPEKQKPYDAFHITRKAIDEEELHRDYDFGQNLISALRNACESVGGSNPDSVPALVALLERKEWRIFQRIALHLLHTLDPVHAGLVRDRLLNRAFFDDSSLWHEYYLLLQKRFGELSSGDQTVILEWIEDAEKRKRLVDEYNDEADQDQKAKWIRYWQYERLSALVDNLPEVWLSRFKELEKEFGEPDIPFGYTSWSGISSYEPKTPKSADDLEIMTNPQIILFLKEWEPPKDRFSSTPSSLAAAWGNLVEQHPDRFLKDLDSFLSAGLDRTYLRGGLLNGLCRATLAERTDLIEHTLDLCQWLMDEKVVVRDLKLPDHMRDGFDADDGWRPIRSAITSFVEDLCDSKRQTPYRFRDQIWALIEPVTTDEDPDLDYERNHLGESWDVMTASLNALRGKALHAMMAYAMWVARNLKAQNPDQRPHLDDMPEVREVLESRLDLQKPFGNRQVDRAVIGRWLPQLVSLNETWVLDHFPKLFPTDPSLRPLRLACFATTVLYVGRLYEKLIPIYLEEVELLQDRKIPEKKYRSYEHRLAEHVVLLYAWEKVGLEADSLVDKFFHVAPSALTAHAMEFLGWDMKRNQDEPVDFEVQTRMKELWDWRIGICEGAENLPSEELQAFGYWFAWGEFDPAWALPYLLIVIRGPGLGHANSYVFERMAQVFSQEPERILELTEEFVETNTDPWFYVGSRKERGIWNLLQQAVHHPIAAIQSKAREIVNLVGSKGHLEFRELLKDLDE